MSKQNLYAPRQASNGDYIISGKYSGYLNWVAVLVLAFSAFFVGVICLLPFVGSAVLAALVLLVSLSFMYFTRFEIVANAQKITFLKKTGKMTIYRWQVPLQTITQPKPNLLLINPELTQTLKIESITFWDEPGCLMISGSSGKKLCLGNNDEEATQIFESIQQVITG